MSSEFIIYGLIDPRDGSLRYVGKSTSGLTRPKNHFTPSRLRERNHRSHWIKSVMATGVRPIILILEECHNEDDLNEQEIFYISYFRYLGCALTNLTEGGEGMTGHRASPATRAKMSAVRKGRKNSPEHSLAIAAGLKGHTISDATRDKMSTAHKGNKYCVGRRVSNETLTKMSESGKRTSWIRGKKLPGEIITKMQKAASLRVKDERGRFVKGPSGT